jgi:15-cis-phytoene synthase
LAGEIRIQWWRDVIAAQPSGQRTGNPVADALLDVIGSHELPVAPFDDYLAARIFDLYDDPLPDRAALETYAGETTSALLQFSAIIADPKNARSAADIAGHGGVAQTIAGMLLLMPRHFARGQVLVPLDVLTACGLDREQFQVDSASAKRAAVREALLALGQEHLAAARSAYSSVSPSLAPAFLPLALTAQTFRRARRMPQTADPVHHAPLLPQWRRQFALLRAATSGSF